MLHIDLTLADTRLIGTYDGANWTVQFYDNMSGRSDLATLTPADLAVIVHAAIIGDDCGHLYDAAREVISRTGIDPELCPIP